MAGNALATSTPLACPKCGDEFALAGRLAGHLWQRHKLGQAEAVELSKRIERELRKPQRRPLVQGVVDAPRDKRARLSAAAKKAWADPEARARLSAAAKKAWADPDSLKRRAEKLLARMERQMEQAP